MSGPARVSVDIGGPASLDIEDAEVGSRWYLPVQFEDVPDDIDLTTITGGIGVIRNSVRDDVIVAEIEIDISRKAESIFALEVLPADHVGVGAAEYVWGMRFAASTPELDQWVPLAGTWTVVDHGVPAATAEGS